jgi:steroid 5-alpha reductase family enzyme
MAFVFNLLDPTGVPLSFLGLAFLLSMLISALGFRRIDYFVSLGYSFSIGAQAVLFPLLYLGTIKGWVIAQTVLLLAYGLRLGGYLIQRERSPSFARELAASKERGRYIKGWLKIAIWVSVSLLYMAMFFPALLTMAAEAHGAATASVAFGVVIMVVGLGLEAAADWQKSRFKVRHPARYCDEGLYAVVRCPNYFGEMIFWLGAFVSGLSAYRSPLAWALAGAGFICIQLIMLGSARRLEIKQSERYGSDEEYRRYVSQVPILFPWVPIYSLRSLRIYLG